jgi:SAM-dependent methyltransferase
MPIPTAEDRRRLVEYFDVAAAHWDEAHGPRSARAHEFSARIHQIRSLCRRFDRPRVLELGCGTGQTLIHLADLVSAGVGVDISPAMIARARENAARFSPQPLQFSVGDVESLADLREPFDLILLVGVLEHLPDPSAALRQAARILSADGRLVVIMPHPWNPQVIASALLDRRQNPPVRHLSPIRLQRLAARQGLSLVTLIALPYSPWPRRSGLAYSARLHELDLNAAGWGRALSAIVRGAYAAELELSAAALP